MQKLIDIITASIAFLSGLKSANTQLKAQLDDSNKNLAEQAKAFNDLEAQHEADELEIQPLRDAAAAAQAAAAAAQAKADELQAEIDAANAKGDELAAAITANSDLPNVDTNFNVQ